MSSPANNQTIKQKIQQLAKDPSNANNILFQIINTNQAHITLNRPKSMNAFSFDMYFKFCQLLQKANQIQEVKYIIIKGVGGNYSSGNDLKNFMNPVLTDLNPYFVTIAMSNMVVQLTQTILKSRKPIFALTQGRVIGFAFTQLALYDKVFSAENSSFIAPLVKIAQGPQMASSYLFPKIFGQSLAEQIIIKGKQMKPKQLQKYNFLTCCKNIEEANKALQAHLKQLDQLDWPSYLQARKLMRLPDRENILIANTLQAENLIQRWSNPQLPAFLMRYLSAKKQKPKL